MPATSQLCDRCGVKWKQDGELCRECARATGAFTKTMQDLERERLERQRERAASRNVIDGSPRADVVRVIRGVEWIVAWDGS